MNRTKLAALSVSAMIFGASIAMAQSGSFLGGPAASPEQVLVKPNAWTAHMAHQSLIGRIKVSDQTIDRLASKMNTDL